MTLMRSDPTQVAIVGSGPYGISIAAHLRERGVSFRIFGPPMRTWVRMPRTLNLKSFGFATSLSVPRPNYTFPEYCRTRGLEDFDPCTMESFAQYGLWVQERLVPEVETAEVTSVKAASGQFELLAGERRESPIAAGRRGGWAGVLHASPGVLEGTAQRAREPFFPTQFVRVFQRQGRRRGRRGFLGARGRSRSQ